MTMSEYSKSGIVATKYKWCSFVLAIVLVLATIQGLSSITSLPNVLGLLSGFKMLSEKGHLAHDVEVTCFRWFIGWGAGSVCGIVLALATASNQLVRALFERYLLLLRGIPIVSIVPLVIRVVGISESGKMFVVGWTSCLLVWIVSHRALDVAREHFRWRTRSLGFSRLTTYSRVILPAAMPAIVSGLRASLSSGLIVLTVAEFSGTYEWHSGQWWSEGLGFRLVRSLEESSDEKMLAVIIIFGLIALAGDFCLLCAIAVASELLARARLWHSIGLSSRIGKDGGPSPGDSVQLAVPLPLEIKELSASYGAKAVIDSFSLVATPGETVAVLGPSGSGKTTLLRAIANLGSPGFHVSGRVRIGGKVVNQVGMVGLVPQDGECFSWMTVLEHILATGEMRKKSRLDATREALSLLARFGLKDHLNKLASELSGGQRQRLAFCTALSNKPAILLLDEVCASSDWLTREKLHKFYADVVRGRITALWITHDLDEALRIADVICVGVNHAGAVVRLSHEERQAIDSGSVDCFAQLRIRLMNSIDWGPRPDA